MSGVINSVSSYYGHTFMGTGTAECLTCGARFLLVATPDGPHDGEYENSAGDQPTQCDGKSFHGSGEAHVLDDCPEFEENATCEHVATDCNCLFCTG